MLAATGLIVKLTAANEKGLPVKAGEECLYPYIAKGVINIRDVEVASGKPLGVSLEPNMFQDYTITVSR